MKIFNNRNNKKIQCLVGTRKHHIHIVCINSINPYNNPMKQVLLVFLNLHMKITKAQKCCITLQDHTPNK